MKANELMIGDWVFCTYPSINKPVRVTEIKTVGDNKLKVVIYDDIRLVFNETYIDPIPLTAEILEKNGFEACGYEELALEADEFCFVLQKGADERNAWWWEMFSSPIIPINHTHELQHALRLCGIEHEITL